LPGVRETGFRSRAGTRAEAAVEAIVRSVVLPVVREDSAGEALARVDWLAGQGLEALELTATIPGWRDVLGAARRRLPGAVLGVGTLRSTADAGDAADLGADFLVTPHPVAGAAEIAAAHEALLVGGGFTPGEVLAAADAGVAKLFPAHAVGPGFLRSVLAIAPDARVIPTGGIGLDDVAAWLDAGAIAVGVGSELRPGPPVEAKLRALRHAP
jgi:2-dehydro-3-deoxyphosphogluconate aldolase / (4S)-4-hydroxy-2-oxoglutarate aldolase